MPPSQPSASSLQHHSPFWPPSSQTNAPQCKGAVSSGQNGYSHINNSTTTPVTATMMATMTATMTAKAEQRFVQH
eukprot:2955008-Prorocentrum_lima.AAC.1